MYVFMTALIASWLAGIAAFAGGVFAFLEGTPETDSKQTVIHGVVAFGGGILIAAIAFALVPQGMKVLSPSVLAGTFFSGAMVFCFLDIILAKSGGSKAQFMAMLMDFIPEAIALGATFGHDRRFGILLALFIGAQNLPEGFNAFRELMSSGVKVPKILAGLLFVSLLGPIAAGTGYIFLQDRQVYTAGVMSFAAGGILYLIFQDIAPDSKLAKHWVPAFGAVLGFLFGMVVKQMLG